LGKNERNKLKNERRKWDELSNKNRANLAKSPAFGLGETLAFEDPTTKNGALGPKYEGLA
jgi:hypothetical protein